MLRCTVRSLTFKPKSVFVRTVSIRNYSSSYQYHNRARSEHEGFSNQTFQSSHEYGTNREVARNINSQLYAIPPFKELFDQGTPLRPHTETSRWLEDNKIDPVFAFKWLFKHYKTAGKDTAICNLLKYLEQNSPALVDAEYFRAIIDIYCKEENLERATYYITHMIERGFTSNEQTTGLYTNLAIRKRKDELAAVILIDLVTRFQHFPENGTVPNLLSSLIRSKKYEMVKNLLVSMKQANLIHKIKLNELLTEAAQYEPQNTLFLLKEIPKVIFAPAASVFQVLMRSLARTSNLDHVLQLADVIQRNFNSKMDPTLFTMVICQCISANNIPLTHQFIHKMRQSGFRPSIVTLIPVVGGFIDMQQPAEALRILFNMRSYNEYNDCLIEFVFTYCLQSHPVLAALIVEEFLQAHTVMANFESMVVQLLTFYRENNHPELYQYTTSLLLNNGFQFKTQLPPLIAPKEEDAITDPLETLNAWKKSPFYQIHLHRVLYVLLKENKITEIKQVISGLTNSQLSATCITIYMKALILSNESDQIRNFIKNNNNFYQFPTHQQMQQVLELAMNRSTADMKKITELLSDLVNTYNFEFNEPILKLLFRRTIQEKQADVAHVIISLMKSSNMELIPYYRDLIELLLAEQELDEAVRVLHELLATLDSFSQYSAIDNSIPAQVILSLIERNQIEYSLRILKETVKKCPPHSNIFRKLLQYYFERRQYPEALQLLKQLREYQMVSDGSIYQAIIDYIPSDFEDTFILECADILLGASFFPTPQIYQSLLVLLLNYKRFDMFSKIVLRMHEIGIRVSDQMFVQRLTMFLDAQDAVAAEKMINAIIQIHTVCSSITLLRVINICLRCNYHQQALTLFRAQQENFAGTFLAPQLESIFVGLLRHDIELALEMLRPVNKTFSPKLYPLMNLLKTFGLSKAEHINVNRLYKTAIQQQQTNPDPALMELLMQIINHLSFSEGPRFIQNVPQFPIEKSFERMKAKYVGNNEIVHCVELMLLAKKRNLQGVSSGAYSEPEEFFVSRYFVVPFTINEQYLGRLNELRFDFAKTLLLIIKNPNPRALDLLSVILPGMAHIQCPLADYVKEKVISAVANSNAKIHVKDNLTGYLKSLRTPPERKTNNV